MIFWILIGLGVAFWLSIGWCTARRFYDHWHASFAHSLRWGNNSEVTEIWMDFLLGPLAYFGSRSLYSRAGQPFKGPGAKSFFRNRRILKERN